MLILVTVGCLILHQRYIRNFNGYANFIIDISSDQGQSQNTGDFEEEIDIEVESTGDNIHISPSKPRYMCNL